MQGWVWRELEQYKTRICEIGVDGHALYNLEGVTDLLLQINTQLITGLGAHVVMLSYISDSVSSSL